jgi:multiple sugar transport system substrate-binding protein
MRNKRVFTLMAVITALSLLLAACAPAATTVPTTAPAATTAPTTAAATTAPTTAPTKPAATTAATAAATTAPTSAGPAIELAFWHGQSTTQEAALKKIVEEFNSSHPGIHVTETYQGTYTDLYKKVTAAVAAGTPPDLAIGYQNDVANYVKSDAVVPLDALMADPQIGFSADDLKDIYPSFIDHYSQFNNQVYSIAFMRSMEVMYYNNDLLKAAGITQAPTSWDDFMKACAAVSKPPTTYCYEMNTDASRFSNWLWSRGGELLSADGKTVAFNSQAGLDTLGFINDLFTKKYAIVISKAFQDQTDFSLGKIAFAFGSSAGLPFYKTAIDQGAVVKDWGIAPSPHTTPNPVVDLYGPSVTIFKTTTDKQRAAFAFLKWMMGNAPNAEWVQATQYFPARASTKAAMATFITANPLYGKAFDWLQYGKNEPTIAAWNPIRTNIADAMTAVANAKSTPQQAMTDLVTKANAAIAAAQ